MTAYRPHPGDERDALTGLPDAACLRHDLRVLLEDAHSLPLAVVWVEFADLPNLRARFGERAAAAAEVEAARRLASLRRVPDRLYRAGHGAFVLVCRTTRRATARLLAGRVRAACEQPTLRHRGCKVAAGWSTAPLPGGSGTPDADELLRKARTRAGLPSEGLPAP